ncbi:hypothetical protein I0Q12_19540 [Rhodococcus sp. CX]|uniref:hypothetical protein n=1 Tax=Rhodococcus sp. CX TaxID=2789880 RepID=UPI0018CD412A|nr:hypothetical protein [Rhodococcus sp. CX]MBH0121585.1 hypothetical protein [Rhodococcus sp. CX]
MIRLRPLVIAPALLLLSACGGESETADNSTQVCTDFSTAQSEISDGIRAGWGGAKADWYAQMDNLVEQIDAAGLTSTNPDIKDRIGQVVQSFPDDPLDLGLSKSAASDFNSTSEAVARACSVAGTEIEIDELPVLPVMRP